MSRKLGRPFVPEELRGKRRWASSTSEVLAQTLGDWVLSARGQLGLTQDALAQILGVTGALVSAWERGNSILKDKHQAQIQALLDGRSGT